MVETNYEKEVQLENLLQNDPLVLDIRVSFISAALLSYRHDTVLRPFPPMFVNESNEKDYKNLERLIQQLKPIKRTQSIDELTMKQKEFFHWVSDESSFSIKHCNNNMFETIKQLTGHTVTMPTPNYIFEVVHSTQNERKFEDLKQSNTTFFTYHGSKIENFHSILNFGLNAHMNKTSLYGEGTYLTSELCVALTFCPTGQSWVNSSLGQKLGCVAVCEVIDHPSVKCQQKHHAMNGQTRSRVQGSMGGEVPEKYYVVQNNELVRVKYLLVYAESLKAPSFRNSWLFEHRFAFLMLSYLVLLLSVALFANKDLIRSIKKLFK